MKPPIFLLPHFHSITPDCHLPILTDCVSHSRTLPSSRALLFISPLFVHALITIFPYLLISWEELLYSPWMACSHALTTVWSFNSFTFQPGGAWPEVTLYIAHRIHFLRYWQGLRWSFNNTVCVYMVSWGRGQLQWLKRYSYHGISGIVLESEKMHCCKQTSLTLKYC